MAQMLAESIYFGLALTLIAYSAGVYVQKRTKLTVLSPIIVATALIIAILVVLKIDYEDYNRGAKYISSLLTPATVCLAIPLYQQISLLKKHLSAVLLGILAGVIASAGSILAMSVMFGLTHGQYVTLLPKSVTTAIGLGLSEELNGIPNITAAAIIMTGVFGNISAPWICRLFRLRSPVAQGLAIGTASHAIGTSRALEIGEIQGAMSSLAVAVAGLMTVVGASLFAALY